MVRFCMLPGFSEALLKQTWLADICKQASSVFSESSKMRKTQHGMFKCLIVLEKPEEELTVGEVARRLLGDETTVRHRINSGA